MRKTAFVVVGLLSLGITACSSSGGGGSTAYADALTDTCQALSKGLDKLDAPTDLASTGAYAKEASALYETAVAAMDKLKPTSDAKDAFEDLSANFNDQVDALDDLAKGASDDDNAAAVKAITTFNTLTDENSDLAKDAGSRRCAIDSALSATGISDPTTTDVTTDDTTEVSTEVSTDDTTDDTQVEDTLPPITNPTSTDVPASAGSGDKIYEDVASQMSPSADGYTFAQVDQSSIDNFLGYLGAVPEIAAADGFYGAVQIESGSTPFTRVFAFVPKTPLADGTVLEFATSVAAPATVAEEIIGGINGQRFTSTDNFEFFIAGDETNGIFMFGAQTAEDLETGVTAFFQSIRS